MAGFQCFVSTASGTGPLVPACRAVVIIYVGVRARVPTDLVKSCRHGFEETNISREAIAEAVDEVLLRHQQLDAGDNRLGVCCSDGPYLPGGYVGQASSVLTFDPIDEYLGLYDAAGRKRIVCGLRGSLVAQDGYDEVAREHTRQNGSDCVD